jgi:hypothetical protein
MTVRESVHEALEVLLLPGIMARGAANQLGYVWLTGGEQPPTKPPRELTTELPLELGEVSRQAERRLRLASTFMAFFWAVMLFTLSSDAILNTIQGCPAPAGPTAYGAVCRRLVLPANPLVYVCMAYLLAQWLFAAFWDPLVMLVQDSNRKSEVPA